MSLLGNLFGKIDPLEHVEINRSHHNFLKRENRWSLWIMSPQYAKAFKAYWSNNGFPLELYPTWLISPSYSSYGGLRYEELEGKHIWMKDPYKDFVKTRIYNEQLHVWIHQLKYEHFVDVAVKTDNFVKRERWYNPNRKGFYACELK